MLSSPYGLQAIGPPSSSTGTVRIQFGFSSRMPMFRRIATGADSSLRLTPGTRRSTSFLSTGLEATSSSLRNDMQRSGNRASEVLNRGDDLDRRSVGPQLGQLDREISRLHGGAELDQLEFLENHKYGEFPVRRVGKAVHTDQVKERSSPFQ